MIEIKQRIKNLIDSGNYPNLKYYYDTNQELQISGFRDAHCHIWGLGMKYLQLNLAGTKSIEECIELIQNCNSRRGNWIVGRGWNQELWDNAIFPDRFVLDKYFPDIPIALYRVDGHCIWANSKALAISEINRHKSNSDILKLQNGEISGILLDDAMKLIECKIPEFSINDLEKFIIKGIDEAEKVGLRAMYDMDVSINQIDIFLKLAQNNQLNSRIKAYISGLDNIYLDIFKNPFSIGNFELAGVKFYLDGAIGSRGAALLESYSDDETNFGLLMSNKDELFNNCEIAINHGFEVAVHAIGDRANRVLIEVFSQLRKKYPKAILKAEHSQIIHPDDIQKFADSRIIASVQPIHCSSDAEMSIKRLGKERCEKRAYLWKTLLENDIQIIGGSDFPIESHDPMLGIDSFVNRKSSKTKNEYFPKEKISLIEAIKAYIE